MTKSDTVRLECWYKSEEHTAASSTSPTRMSSAPTLHLDLALSSDANPEDEFVGSASLIVSDVCDTDTPVDMWLNLVRTNQEQKNQANQPGGASTLTNSAGDVRFYSVLIF